MLKYCRWSKFFCFQPPGWWSGRNTVCLVIFQWSIVYGLHFIFHIKSLNGLHHFSTCWEQQMRFFLFLGSIIEKSCVVSQSQRFCMKQAVTLYHHRLQDNHNYMIKNYNYLNLKKERVKMYPFYWSREDHTQEESGLELWKWTF